MKDVKILDVLYFSRIIADLFQNNLISLGYKTELNHMHEVIPNDSDLNDIRSISRSQACELLYLAIQSSNGFSIQNPAHEVFFSKNEKFELIYQNLVKYILNKLELPIGHYLVQKLPTLRVQFPGVNTSSVWHRDSDFGHPQGEINFWMPLTEVDSTTTLWFQEESEYSTNVNFGTLVCFDGDLVHGTRSNTSGKTRVSMDFRIIHKQNFQVFVDEKLDLNSISRGVSFSNGYYGDVN